MRALHHSQDTTFQFTHPGRGATHSPSDVDALRLFQFTHPGRGATLPLGGFVQTDTFQFTHPGRGATVHAWLYTERSGVSIHAPREGCDQ